MHQHKPWLLVACLLSEYVSQINLGSQILIRWGHLLRGESPPISHQSDSTRAATGLATKDLGCSKEPDFVDLFYTGLMPYTKLGLVGCMY